MIDRKQVTMRETERRLGMRAENRDWSNGSTASCVAHRVATNDAATTDHNARESNMSGTRRAKTHR